MSILNRPSDGLFNVLIVLIRCSITFGVMPRAKLLDLCAPKTLGDGKQDMAAKTLNRWTQLGLFETPKDDHVRIVDEYRSFLKKESVPNSAIATVVRQLIFAKENVVNFWEEEENRTADFCRAAAWMLAQDIYSFNPTSYVEVENRSNAQTRPFETGKSIFRGDVTWPGYSSWSSFLGLGHSDSGKASGGHIIDPTRAIRAPLLAALPKKGDISIKTVLDQLSMQLPVIDGGEYRKMVEENLLTEKWRPPGAGELSMSLSRSFLRLRESGEIRLETKSDADAQVKLVGRNHRVIQEITHIRRGDAK